MIETCFSRSMGQITSVLDPAEREGREGLEFIEEEEEYSDSLTQTPFEEEEEEEAYSDYKDCVRYEACI